VKVFYGWRIAVVAGVLQFLIGGLMVHAFGAYIALMADEKGWSKAALAGGAALLALEGALIGPVLGWAMDKFGGRAIVQVGLVVLALGFVSLSQVDTMAGFYGTMLVLAVGTSLSGYFPLNITLVHWFRKYRARALAFASLGLALGGVAVPLVAWTMQTWGWRATAIGSAVVAIVVGIPLARVIRRNPSEVGETEDGLPPVAPSSAPIAEDDPAPPEREFTAREALRTSAFWLLALGHAFALLVVTTVNVHAITHMKEGLGYSVAQASLVITLMTVAQAVGVLVGAAIGDRFSKIKVAGACMLAHALGLLMLTYAVHPVMLGAFAVLHGVAWGVRGPLMQAIRADYFGLRAIGMIMGLSAFIISAGQIAGPMLAGAFADWQGHYRWGFTLLAVVAATGSVLFVMAKKPQ
jgi:MFS family permease